MNKNFFYFLILLCLIQPIILGFKYSSREHLNQLINGNCVFGYGLNTYDDGSQNCLPCFQYEQFCSDCTFTNDIYNQCDEYADVTYTDLYNVQLLNDDALFCGENIEICIIDMSNGLQSTYILQCNDSSGQPYNLYYVSTPNGGYDICMNPQCDVQNEYNNSINEDVYYCWEECQNGYLEGFQYNSQFDQQIRQCIECDTQLVYSNQMGEICELQCQPNEHLVNQIDEQSQTIIQNCIECDTYIYSVQSRQFWEEIQFCQPTCQQGEMLVQNEDPLYYGEISQCIQCDTFLVELENDFGRFQVCNIECQPGEMLVKQFDFQQNTQILQCIPCNTHIYTIYAEIYGDNNTFYIDVQFCYPECQNGEMAARTFDPQYQQSIYQCIACNTQLYENQYKTGQWEIYRYDECYVPCSQGQYEVVTQNQQTLQMTQQCFQCQLNCISCYYLYDLQNSFVFQQEFGNLTKEESQQYSVQCIECVQGMHWNAFVNSCVQNPLNSISCQSISFKDYLNKLGFCQCNQGYYFNSQNQSCEQSSNNSETCLEIKQQQYYDQYLYIYMPSNNFYMREKCEILLQYSDYQDQEQLNIDYRGNIQNQQNLFSRLQEKQGNDYWDFEYNQRDRGYTYQEIQQMWQDYKSSINYQTYAGKVNQQFFGYNNQQSYYINDILCENQKQYYLIQNFRYLINQNFNYLYNDYDGTDDDDDYYSNQTQGSTEPQTIYEEIFLNYSVMPEASLLQDIQYFNNNLHDSIHSQLNVRQDDQIYYKQQDKLKYQYFYNLQNEIQFQNVIQDIQAQQKELVLNNKICKCNQGFYWNYQNQVCEQIPQGTISCDIQQYVLTFYYINNTYDDGETQFPFEQLMCKCPDGQYYDHSSTSCLPLAGADQCKSIPIFEIVNNNTQLQVQQYNTYCTCKIGYYRNEFNTCSQCPQVQGCEECQLQESEEFQYRGIQCLNCPSNQVWNPVVGQCVNKLLQCDESYFNISMMQLRCRDCLLSQYDPQNNCCPEGCQECIINNTVTGGMQCTKCTEARRFNDPNLNCVDDPNNQTNQQTSDSTSSSNTNTSNNTTNPNNTTQNDLTQCLNGLENLVSGVIQQSIQAITNQYQISLFFDPNVFVLNTNCFTQTVFIGQTEIQNYDQNDGQGVVFTIQSDTIDTDYAGCISEANGSVYCVLSYIIYFNNIEQNIYTFNLYQNTLTQTIQIESTATQEQGIDLTNPNNIQSEIQFCTDFTCNTISNISTFQRRQIFYFQLVITSQQYQHLMLSHHSLQIGQFTQNIPDIDINANIAGKIIYRTSFQLALGQTDLSVTVKLNGNFVRRRMLSDQNQQKKDYGIQPTTSITILDEANYNTFMQEQSKNDQNSNSEDSKGKNQDSQNQNEGKLTEAETIAISTGVSILSMLILGGAIYLVVKFFRSKKNKQKNQETVQMKYEVDKENGNENDDKSNNNNQAQVQDVENKIFQDNNSIQKEELRYSQRIDKDQKLENQEL